MSRGTVRDHMSSAILEAAASVISEQGGSASMADVAGAAGIGRATLYRYFASREELLGALATAAVDDASARLTAADLGSVPVGEALARVARAMVACGIKFSALIDEPQYIDRADVDRRVGGPVRAVLRRGVEDGTLRRDLPMEVLFQLWGGLLAGAFRSMSELDDSVESASAVVITMFLEGASHTGSR